MVEPLNIDIPTNWYFEKIIIDSREGNRGINGYNFYSKNYLVDVQTMEYGDFFFKGKMNSTVFEYKTTSDFINSIQNKSLFNEIANQSIKHKYSYLIIEGDWEKSLDDIYFKVPAVRYKFKQKFSMHFAYKKMISGALARVSAMYVPYIIVDDEKTAFKTMLDISKKVNDNKRYGGVVRPSRSKLKSNACVTFLSGVNGIGEKLANRICVELNITSLDGLLLAKKEDFISVSGVSPIKANRIWEQLHDDELEDVHYYS